MSTVIAAGEDALLPEAVTLAQFKTWLAVSTAEESEAGQMLFSSLCTVIEVGATLCRPCHMPACTLLAYTCPKPQLSSIAAMPTDTLNIGQASA